MTDELAPLFGALHLTPTDGQAASLATYLDLLQQWNATYNLTAVRDRRAMRVQHLADCLAVVPALAARLGAGRILDVGSGGGLPGVVLAVMLPSFDVTCVDTVGKKVAFIRQVAAQLALPNLHAVHARAEKLPPSDYDVITSRAFASLSDFVRMTRDLLAPTGCWMALKGKHPADEIAQLSPEVHVFHVEPLDVPLLGAERCIVWMKRGSATKLG